MSLGRKVFAVPARLWMNWPLWGGLLAMLLLAKHAWVLFAPPERAVPGTTAATGSAQAEQLFGVVSTAASTASLNGIRPIGIFAHSTKGFAVMQTESGQIGVGMGEQVIPGVRLVETHPDHVVLERNGIRQRVDLSTPSGAGGGIAQAGSDSAPDADADAPATLAPAAPAQALSQLTPEQRAMLQQQQQQLQRQQQKFILRGLQ